MSLRLTVRPLAEADLREARDWYDERRPGLGGEFLAAVDDLLHSIAQNPRAFPAIAASVVRFSVAFRTSSTSLSLRTR